MREASSAFSSGRKIRENPCSFAKITDGNTELTGRKIPSSASSPIKREDSIISVSKITSFERIPTAIGRSKLGHFLRISAGARFTVMRVGGK